MHTSENDRQAMAAPAAVTPASVSCGHSTADAIDTPPRCCCRRGADVKRLLSRPGTVLSELAANVVVVEDPVTSDISSTKLREQVRPRIGWPASHAVAAGHHRGTTL